MCKLLYIILIAVGAVVLNVYWETVETFVNTFKQGDPIKINTVFGPLIGQTGLTRGGRTIYKFTSIPYAKPPLGQLRFEVTTFKGLAFLWIAINMHLTSLHAATTTIWKMARDFERHKKISNVSPSGIHEESHVWPRRLHVS